MNTLLAAFMCIGFYGGSLDFEPGEHEEYAGSTCSFFFNGHDDIFGLGIESGLWLRESPVYGDYFLRFFSNDIEDAWYSGAGMTLRLMPHWRFAPFAGIGGSYNHSLGGSSDDSFDPADGSGTTRGESYWGGHVEAGLRVYSGGGKNIFELTTQYTWSSASGAGRDYWLVGIRTGRR